MSQEAATQPIQDNTTLAQADAYDNTLDELFGETPAEPTAESAPDHSTTAPPADKTGDSVVSTPTAKEGTSTPPAVPDGYAPVSALQAERQKRQEVELELARLQGRAEALQAQSQPSAEEPETDFWDDPNAALTSVRSEVKQELERFKQSMWEERAAESERLAETRYDDYVAVRDAALARSKADPAWAQALRNTPGFNFDPAEAVYQAEKKLQAVENFDPKKSREELRAELLAELKKEGRLVDDGEDLPSLPRSQAGAAGSGPDTDHQVIDEGDAALRDILPNY